MGVHVQNLREGMFVEMWQATVASVEIIDHEAVVKTLAGGVHKVLADAWFVVA